MAKLKQWKARKMLLLAAGIVAVCMFVPYGYLAVYPFQLFGTFIHEAGHALAAVMTGGEVQSMVVNLDTSGYVKRFGGSGPIVASAGYLASVLVGALLLFLGRKPRWAKPTLVALGVATLVITALFSGYGGSILATAVFGLGLTLVAFGRAQKSRGKPGASATAVGGLAFMASLAFVWITGGLVTWMVGMLMGAGALAVAAYASRFVQHLAVLFLGVQISLDGINSIQVLFNLTSSGHEHNDAQSMAEYTGLPAEFWALSWGLMGVALIAGAFWMFWRDDR